jgi:hypothetical protein
MKIEGIDYDKELTEIKNKTAEDQELFIKSPELYSENKELYE